MSWPTAQQPRAVEDQGAVRPSRGRLPGIDGLRAVAAGSIVLHHCWLYAMPAGSPRPGGARTAEAFDLLALGVTIFFALSGFLLYRPIAAAVLRGSPLPGVRAYFRNRALRILPAYWVILLVCALGLRSTYVGWEDGRLGEGALTDGWRLLQAATLAQGFHPGTLLVGIGPAWSLAVEAVFYLSLPLLGLLAARLGPPGARARRRLLAVLVPPVLLLAIGLSGKTAAWLVVPGAPMAGFSPTWHAVVERSFWAQADLFTFGMLVAVVHALHRDGALTLPRRWRPAAVAVLVVLSVPAAATLRGAELSYLPQNTVLAAAAALLIAVVVIPGPGGSLPRATRWLERRPVAAVGLVSYSLFLWHEPVTRWLADRGLTHAGWSGLAGDVLLVAGVALGLSALSYRWVERPALRRRDREPATRPPGPAGDAQAAP
jgi:peptidoglycan/LPS O-acetylase OafA/YrhL